MLINLAIHPEWREKCKKDIQDMISRHISDSLPSAMLSEKLKAIPIFAWEKEDPLLEICTWESQRIAITGVVLQRNLRRGTKISGRAIRQGDFLGYPLADAHLNPKYYPEPYQFDPGQWLRPGPIPNAVYPFIGWGTGRHPCPGMKVAKLEMKLIMAMFLMRYEFDLVDKDRKFPDPLSIPDRNDVHQVLGIANNGALHICSPCLSRPSLLGLHPTSTSRRLCSRQMTNSTSNFPLLLTPPSDPSPGEDFI